MSKTVRNLTYNEKEVISSLAEAWNRFLKLPELHADDVPEFRQAIHRAQNIVMARPVFEDINN